MKALAYILIPPAAAFAQWIFSDVFSMTLFAPDMVFIFAISAAVSDDSAAAFFMAFLLGLYRDLLGADLFGANAMVYVSVCYGVFVMKKRFDFESAVPQAVLVFFATVFHFAFFQVLASAFSGISHMSWGFLAARPFVNAFSAPFVFFAVSRFAGGTRKRML